jgi:hypothetical protein
MDYINRRTAKCIAIMALNGIDATFTNARGWMFVRIDGEWCTAPCRFAAVKNILEYVHLTSGE